MTSDAVSQRRINPLIAEAMSPRSRGSPADRPVSGGRGGGFAVSRRKGAALDLLGRICPKNCDPSSSYRSSESGIPVP